MQIEDHRIDLWYVHDEAIIDHDLKSQYYDLLSADEKQRLHRFYFEKDRHQFLITRALLRVVLSKYHEKIKPKEWKFDTNKYGKPFISNIEKGQAINFNLSHSKNLIILAVAQHEKLGIDVEYLMRKGGLIELANAFFSPKEVSQLDLLDDEIKMRRFFDLWTLKEAYVKACGMGLSISLSDFSYIFNKYDQFHIEFNSERIDTPENWYFWRVNISEKHAISLALKSKVEKQKFEIEVMEILPLQHDYKVDFEIRFCHGVG
jgi:4'-phosphopantetheinyl transferase